MNYLLTFLEKLQAQNIIAVFALALAYLVYRKSKVDEYRSWIDLAKSFQHELSYAKHWIGGSYNNSINLDWLKPSKLVYPLTDESVKALIWKGHPPKGIFSDDFFDKLAIYNERIEAFNHLLKIQGLNYASCKFETDDEGEKQKTNHINSIIHNDLIGNNGDYHLHSLYEYFKCELKMIDQNGISAIPWYFRYPKTIILLTFVVYMVIDYFIT